MLLALASSSAIAQSRKDSLTTKVVDVVKSYAPTIADADKKREDAKIKDSLTVKKKKINYTIYSARARVHPVSSAPARCCLAWSFRAAGWAAGTVWRYGQNR